MIARDLRAALLVPLLVVGSCHSARIAPSASNSLPPGARERVLRAGDLALYAVEWTGSGTPIVLLHGLGGNAATWAGLVRQLPGRHVIAIDLPGHGMSPMPSSWDIARLARDIVAAVRARWPGAHIWVGHSWGGKLAVAAAATDSDGTRGLILVDAVPASPYRIGDPAGVVESLFAGELDPWPSLDSALVSVRHLPQFTPWTAEVELAFRRAVAVQRDGRVIPLLSRAKGIAILQSLATDLTQSAAAIRSPVLVLSAPHSFFEQAQHVLFPTADFVSLAGNHWLQISNVRGVSSAVLTWLSARRL